MGSCNFRKSDYLTLGATTDTLTSESTPTDSEIAEYRDAFSDNCENMTDEQIIECMRESNDAMLEDMLFDAKQLVEMVNSASDCHYVRLALEHGYHNGFRIVIDDSDIMSHTGVDFIDEIYADALEHGDIAKDISLDEFRLMIDKEIDYLQYVLARVSKVSALTGIGGGWTGGAYELPKSELLEQDHFVDRFNRMAVKAKYDKLYFTTFDFDLPEYA